MTLYGLGICRESGGKATGSGLRTLAILHFSRLHALISLTQALYLRNGFDSFVLLFGTCHVQNKQAPSQGGV